ncbi:MAG: menaquinone biosynthesis protein [Acidobacteriota bacterium]
MVRLGAVNYLNVRPLVYGLGDRPDVSLRFDVPSTCARLLADGEIDLGMVPSITYADRPGDRIVPGVCIGSDGPVASVALFTRKPMRDVQRIALDTSSRTSAALVRIVCRRVFDVAPDFQPHAPEIASMLDVADAALLIGDPALFFDPPPGVTKVDLGAVWSGMTGLPFVWAFWSGRSGAVDASTLGVLQQAAAAGGEHIDDIARAYLAATPERIPLAARYLRENLVFTFGPREQQGLETYYREAADLGLIPAAPHPVFFAPRSAD